MLLSDKKFTSRTIIDYVKTHCQLLLTKKSFDVDDMNDFKNLKEILQSGQKNQVDSFNVQYQLENAVAME